MLNKILLLRRSPAHPLTTSAITSTTPPGTPRRRDFSAVKPKLTIYKSVRYKWKVWDMWCSSTCQLVEEIGDASIGNITAVISCLLLYSRT